jgi:hypothetical protein
MAFDPAVQVQALYRAGNRCECTSGVCGDHPDNDGRCQEPIGGGQFFAIKTDPAGLDTLLNCELICPACFEHRAN